mgnify:CR=1 FL=1
MTLEKLRPSLNQSDSILNLLSEDPINSDSPVARTIILIFIKIFQMKLGRPQYSGSKSFSEDII